MVPCDLSVAPRSVGSLVLLAARNLSGNIAAILGFAFIGVLLGLHMPRCRGNLSREFPIRIGAALLGLLLLDGVRFVNWRVRALPRGRFGGDRGRSRASSVARVASPWPSPCSSANDVPSSATAFAPAAVNLSANAASVSLSRRQTGAEPFAITSRTYPAASSVSRIFTIWTPRRDAGRIKQRSSHWAAARNINRCTSASLIVADFVFAFVLDILGPSWAPADLAPH
jgi:hypothetical protein